MKGYFYNNNFFLNKKLNLYFMDNYFDKCRSRTMVLRVGSTLFEGKNVNQPE